MSPSENRGRITLRPLGDDQRLALTSRRFPLPRGSVALAEYVGEPGDGGHLVRLANGALAIWLDRGALRSVDPRKAEAALAALKIEGVE